MLSFCATGTAGLGHCLGILGFSSSSDEVGEASGGVRTKMKADSDASQIYGNILTAASLGQLSACRSFASHERKTSFSEAALDQAACRGDWVQLRHLLEVPLQEAVHKDLRMLAETMQRLDSRVAKLEDAQESFKASQTAVQETNLKLQFLETQVSEFANQTHKQFDLLKRAAEQKEETLHRMDELTGQCEARFQSIAERLEAMVQQQDRLGQLHQELTESLNKAQVDSCANVKRVSADCQQEVADAAEAKKYRDILEAAEKGSVAAVRHFVTQDPAAVKEKSSRGQTALHWAAFGGDPDMCRFLLERRADVEAANPWGETPLHAAAYHVHVETTKVLLSFGADIHAKDKEGKTPLDYAKRNGKTEVVKLLEAQK